MRIYFDVSCLNRPYDDQRQARIHLEAQAVLLILQRCATGEWEHVSSGIGSIEVEAIRDAERRARVRGLLLRATQTVPLSEPTFQRAEIIGKMGIKPADALHVAAAEELTADVLLTCDDRLERAARRHRRELKVRVANPLAWLTEIENAKNA